MSFSKHIKFGVCMYLYMIAWYSIQGEKISIPVNHLGNPMILQLDLDQSHSKQIHDFCSTNMLFDHLCDDLLSKWSSMIDINKNCIHALPHQRRLIFPGWFHSQQDIDNAYISRSIEWQTTSIVEATTHICHSIHTGMEQEHLIDTSSCSQPIQIELQDSFRVLKNLPSCETADDTEIKELVSLAVALDGNEVVDLKVYQGEEPGLITSIFCQMNLVSVPSCRKLRKIIQSKLRSIGYEYTPALKTDKPIVHPDFYLVSTWNSRNSSSFLCPVTLNVKQFHQPDLDTIRIDSISMVSKVFKAFQRFTGLLYRVLMTVIVLWLMKELYYLSGKGQFAGLSKCSSNTLSAIRDESKLYETDPQNIVKSLTTTYVDSTSSSFIRNEWQTRKLSRMISLPLSLESNKHWTDHEEKRELVYKTFKRSIAVKRIISFLKHIELQKSIKKKRNQSVLLLFRLVEKHQIVIVFHQLKISLTKMKVRQSTVFLLRLAYEKYQQENFPIYARIEANARQIRSAAQVIQCAWRWKKSIKHSDKVHYRRLQKHAGEAYFTSLTNCSSHTFMDQFHRLLRSESPILNKKKIQAA